MARVESRDEEAEVRQDLGEENGHDGTRALPRLSRWVFWKPLRAKCGFSEEFVDYLNYCKSLKFEDQPDYAMLRQRFRQLFYAQNYTYDYVFDWNLLM